MSAARADATLDALLEFVKETRGFDFTGYKRSTIERRVAKRMAAVGVERYDDYVDYLELHGNEFAELFNTLLINITGFFRDPETWEYLADRDRSRNCWRTQARLRRCGSGAPAAPRARRPTRSRWCFARVLGDASFRERVKIYATDIDEEALDQARHGAYLPRQIEDVPHDALERFFERTDQRYRVPQGSAAVRDLRPQRPDPGRADLAHRPARVPQHADVLHRGDADADPAAVPLRARQRRHLCCSASPRC